MQGTDSTWERVTRDQGLLFRRGALDEQGACTSLAVRCASHGLFHLLLPHGKHSQQPGNAHMEILHGAKEQKEAGGAGWHCVGQGSRTVNVSRCACLDLQG